MAKYDYRHSARAHLKAAQGYLVQPGEEAARHACFELRMTIEALTYEVLQAYLEEVPDSIMAQWTPKKVLDELLEIDPHADQTATIFFGKEETPGVQATKMEYLGTDKRFRVKWGNKAHNALGNFLHEPTIAQREKSVDFDAAARAKAVEVLAELVPIVTAPFFQSNFGNYVTLTCECSFVIKRKEAVLLEKKPFTCGGCGREYDYAFNEESDAWTFRVSKTRYECIACKAENWVESHELAKFPVLTCKSCEAKAQVKNVLSLEPVPPDA